MQVVQIVGGYGLGQNPAVDAAINHLQAFLSTLAGAPATEFVSAGVSEDTRVHVPDFEMEPWGKYQFELSTADAQALDADVETVIASIEAVGVQNVRRLLVESDAKPPPLTSAPTVKDWVRKAKNLIDIYRREVLRQKPRMSGLVIASGIGIGLIVVGVIAYAKWQEQGGRWPTWGRRRRRR